MEIIQINDKDNIITEKKYIEDKENKEFTIKELISFLKLNKNIFIKDDIVIPFNFYENKVYCIFEKPKYKIIFETILEELKYNLNNLTEISLNQIYNNELDKYKYYFIINNKYYINKA